MRRSIYRRFLGMPLAVLAAGAGALIGSASPAGAASEPSGGCVTQDIHLDPPARQAGWTVECASRRYVFVETTVFAGGVADSNPRETRWVEAGETWNELKTYEQTNPPIDHLCVHIVTYEDPTNPFEIPATIGHRCI
ncbi:hypothetical protein [Amycolatopsis anabasis]|uniref:hypothetical protein n=1 Tax=Amycolatopsis anabasis TaxID=1840409 RepID=UPI00131C4A98|nr:hypothetical protein [Amycolatopsis anabasis]